MVVTASLPSSRRSSTAISDSTCALYAINDGGSTFRRLASDSSALNARCAVSRCAAARGEGKRTESAGAAISLDVCARMLDGADVASIVTTDHTNEKRRQSINSTRKIRSLPGLSCGLNPVGCSTPVVYRFIQFILRVIQFTAE